ncbi:hypothetical protein pb186bvf_004898 [Paramecium bursaria]
MKFGQRIIFTKKGIELQEQLKLEQKKELPKENPALTAYSKQFYEKEQAKEQKVESKLSSPKYVKEYLSGKFDKSDNALFIKRELDKISSRVIKLGSRTGSHTHLPSLDFKQKQFLKTKYNNSAEKLDTMSITSGTFYKTQQDDNKQKSYILFQESKLDRMIKKFERFTQKTKDMPRYLKNQPRIDISTMLKAIQSEETRVESLQELNSRLGEQLALMSYNSAYDERQKQAMQELHYKRYMKQWQKGHFPK